ncbi:SAGA complex ubiquitin C-terminal hydrolase Ubp8 [Schizosaccharomyces osmophilus]|uniref:Ubiquitin carboxyl-terminal hydrolase n=1 Tax=Schizosaccharomyces osmophilus TaxID=2545709 RepID=A0AAE9W808_9SCHI|nr:SAGA complex ubiquitin C-terminal hydrolase Ubp8 [Schizosaccharomyces osmophilus]WBW71429.1 SAGA complex ubiquitin C-terminal hydrolase Ubp8 [Schizosaccharomyces osmophilus]
MVNDVETCPHVKLQSSFFESYHKICAQVFTRNNLRRCCSVCKKSNKRTLRCLECEFTGCLWDDHFEQHVKELNHSFGADLKNSHIYCYSCQDYVYHPRLEMLRIKVQNIRSWQNKHKRLPDRYEQTISLNPYEKYPSICPTAGLRGIQNLGATCFMSVILQSTLHNPLLRNLFLSGFHTSENCKRSSCMTCAIDNMFASIYASKEKTSFYGPTVILNLMWKLSKSLSGYSQQDGHEFLVYLLDQMHSESGGDNSFPCNCPIHKIFSGSMKSVITCCECKTKKVATDPLMEVSLDLHEPSIQGCLERYISPEQIQYTCSNCNAKVATKQLFFDKLPPTLCLQLKRFEQNSFAMSTKVDKLITYPMLLKMQYNFNHDSVNYQLYAIVCHKGTLDTGHYIAYTLFQGHWYLLDDTTITVVPESEVLKTQAYLLFYHEKNLVYDDEHVEKS